MKSFKIWYGQRYFEDYSRSPPGWTSSYVVIRRHMQSARMWLNVLQKWRRPIWELQFSIQYQNQMSTFWSISNIFVTKIHGGWKMCKIKFQDYSRWTFIKKKHFNEQFFSPENYWKIYDNEDGIKEFLILVKGPKHVVPRTKYGEKKYISRKNHGL